MNWKFSWRVLEIPRRRCVKCISLFYYLYLLNMWIKFILTISAIIKLILTTSAISSHSSVLYLYKSCVICIISNPLSIPHPQQMQQQQQAAHQQQQHQQQQQQNQQHMQQQQQQQQQMANNNNNGTISTGPKFRPKPQACKICGKVLSSASSYYVHMKLHSGNKPYHCTACDASFCRKPYLEVSAQLHMVTWWLGLQLFHLGSLKFLWLIVMWSPPYRYHFHNLDSKNM